MTTEMIQLLEHRRLFSVTVSQGYPGFYEIHADDSGNAINVSVSSADDTFTLDGTTYAGLQYLTVYGGAGNDTIHVLADAPSWYGASIQGGAGNDNIELNFDGAIWAGDGNDTVRLADSFRGEVYGEAGDDHMYVSGETIDAQIDGGDGNDVIDASDNHYGVVIFGGAGDDTIYGSQYDDQIYGGAGNNTLYGNRGNDAFYAGANDRVFGGGGSDLLYGTTASWNMDSVEHVYAS
jgi:Ca2+-binding RTX toxin-like protein